MLSGNDDVDISYVCVCLCACVCSYNLATTLLAPTLSNIYFNAMVTRWHSQSGEAGVPILYKHGRKLVGD